MKDLLWLEIWADLDSPAWLVLLGLGMRGCNSPMVVIVLAANPSLPCHRNICAVLLLASSIGLSCKIDNRLKVFSKCRLREKLQVLLSLLCNH